MFRVATELVINISSEWVWLVATAIRSFALGRFTRWMSLKRKGMTMTKSAESLTTFKPQPVEQIKPEHDAGLTSPTDKDRDVTVMADRFAKMSLNKEDFAAMCDKAKTEQETHHGLAVDGDQE